MQHPDIIHTMSTGYPNRAYLEYEKYARRCDVCKTGMNEGYLHEGAGTVYCSSDCAEKDLPDMDELMEADILYWTDWHYEL